jgi:hypothetical protein
MSVKTNLQDFLDLLLVCHRPFPAPPIAETHADKARIAGPIGDMLSAGRRRVM